jgi:hypothetical protein
VYEETKKAAGLGPDDGAQSGRIYFEVVKGLIWRQVKDGSPNHMRTAKVYNDGFRCLQGLSRRKEVLFVQLRGGFFLVTGVNPEKVSRADSTCPCCADEEETLEYVV